MRLRFPLLPKILTWFFLNLVVLGAVFYVVLKVQFHLCHTYMEPKYNHSQMEVQTHGGLGTE